VERVPVLAGLSRVAASSVTSRKVHEAINRDIPARNERLCSIFWHPAVKNTPETRRAI
jgi:hypothetical protein